MNSCSDAVVISFVNSVERTVSLVLLTASETLQKKKRFGFEARSHNFRLKQGHDGFR